MFLKWYTSQIYIYVCVCGVFVCNVEIYIYVYIYIYRERERCRNLWSYCQLTNWNNTTVGLDWESTKVTMNWDDENRTTVSSGLNEMVLECLFMTTEGFQVCSQRKKLCRNERNSLNPASQQGTYCLFFFFKFS